MSGVRQSRHAPATTNPPETSMKRIALLAALLSATLVLPAVHATGPDKAQAAEAQEKVVYHINDASVARVAMRNIENHLNASPGVKIVVVTHGKGIDFLLNDAKDDKGAYAPQVAGLKERGAEFRVCRNTLSGRKLTDEAVILEAQVVPSGVAEIGRLQAKEGFVYLKP
jgi:intracellular sulfur oxidation DsrE/DsrF family protein